MAQLSSSIFVNLFEILGDKKLFIIFRNIFILVGIKIIATYYETLITTALITEKVDIKFNLKLLLGTSFFLTFVSYVITYYKRKYLFSIIDEEFKKRFWSFFELSSANFLNEEKDTIYTAIMDGSYALNSICSQGIWILQPITQIIMQLYIVFKFCGFYGFILCASLSTIFFSGIYTLKIAYDNNKSINKERTEMREFNRNFSKNFHIEVINGHGPLAAEIIVNNESKIYNLSLPNDLERNKYSKLLECWSGFLMYLLFDKLYTSSSKENIVVFYAIQNSFQFSWWLFNMTNNLLQSASSWGKLEDLIEKHQIRNDPINDIDLTQIAPNFSCGEEIWIKAPSGGGKTTWMTNTVYKCMDKFRQGQIMYLNQNMSVNLGDRSIYDIMSDYCKKHINVKQLLIMSEDLDIDNIINENTIYEKFQKPSMGEQKRILFLRSILPIICNPKNDVKVIFCDEITSGLDHQQKEKSSFQKVRNVIDMLKKKHNISFVTIDHHDIPKSDISKSYVVNKKVIDVEVTNEKNVSYKKVTSFSILNLIFDYVQKAINEYKKLDNNKSKTKIEVWLTEENSDDGYDLV